MTSNRFARPRTVLAAALAALASGCATASAPTMPTAGATLRPEGGYPVKIAAADPSELAIQAKRFMSNKFDLYLLDADSNTVTTIPGVTGFGSGSKTNPSLSRNGKYLAWQTDEYGNADLYVTNLNSVGNIQQAASSSANEKMPAVDNQGRVVFVYSNASGDKLKRFTGTTTQTFSAVTLRQLTFPSVSGDGTLIAFGGANPPGKQRVFLYNTSGTSVVNPSASNIGTFSYNPSLNGNGKKLLFVSNALGSEDVFELTLSSNQLNTLSFLNGISTAKKQAPRYLGSGTQHIAFQVTNGTLGRVAVFDRSDNTIATLSSQNSLGSPTLLRTP